MAIGRLIECGCDNFRVHTALHVRDFLRTLVNQQNQEVNLRMVQGNCIRNILE